MTFRADDRTHLKNTKPATHSIDMATSGYAPRLRRVGGLTIIQLMVTLFVAGIIGALLVDFIIDKRCEDNPSVKLCLDRKAGGK